MNPHDPTTDHDDLWDRSGTPDPELRALEQALRAHRWQGPTPQLDAGTHGAATSRPGRDTHARSSARASVGPELSLGRRALIAACVMLGLGLALRSVMFPQAPSYPVTWFAENRTPRHTLLHPGDALLAPSSGSARIEVADIGWLELEAGGRLRVAAAHERSRSDTEHFVHLDHGVLRASIFAAPRVFQVGTPGGLAVDMGCIYTTEVLTEGLTRLEVESGQVSFESAARQVTVPEGAGLVAHPDRGPGTPAWHDASASYRELLARVDAGHADPGDLEALLRDEQTRDGLGLAHLLDVAPASWRAALVDALAQHEPPRDTRWPALVLAGNADALHDWKREMSWSW
ncbi:MAG: hypothetical protein DHS20C15_18750 [Planctomycetota bacterium]|nr:MAG: hypothetical protein DHS20C15_18750 [Planctomycetota bacterium]